MADTAPKIERYFHCRKCMASPGKSARIEVGLTRSGVRVDCKKHGLIGHLTPDGISGMIIENPPCECCAGGKHLS